MTKFLQAIVESENLPSVSQYQELQEDLLYKQEEVKKASNTANTLESRMLYEIKFTHTQLIFIFVFNVVPLFVPSLSFSFFLHSFLLLLSENTQLQKDLHNINEVSIFPDVHIILLYLQMEDKIKKELETLKENISTMQQVGEMYQIILYYIVYCYRRLKCLVT